MILVVDQPPVMADSQRPQRAARPDRPQWQRETITAFPLL